MTKIVFIIKFPSIIKTSSLPETKTVSKIEFLKEMRHY